jgi:S-formylglutathione hydrolase FrmB
VSIIKLDFFSHALKMDQSLNVILPDKGEMAPSEPFPENGAGYPVLYLLHGTSHDFSSWARYTSIERYACDKRLAIVMPSAQLSGYADMVYGEDFFSYIAIEVPGVVKRLFPISQNREDTFIAGLSMGGYGAAKIGLSLPENYAAIGSLSNGNHAYIRTIGFHARNPQESFSSTVSDQRHLFCWGLDKSETPIGTEQDLYFLAKRNIDENRPLPTLFHTVGSFDRNLAQARHMRDFFMGLKGNPYHYIYYEEPYGEHTWIYWDKWIQTFLAWLPVKLQPSTLPL